MAQGLNTAPLHKSAARLLTEHDSLMLYSAATALDGAPGEYPPDDTGSDGLSVCKAAKQRGLIGSYTHAFGFDHAQAALQLSPTLWGINWHEDMFNPDSKGFVHPTGAVAGGHEIVCVRDSGTYLEFINSWSRSWGLNGRFRLTYDDARMLLAADGDVVVPVP
jgi:hypothetical protein